MAYLQITLELPENSEPGGAAGAGDGCIHAVS